MNIKILKDYFGYRTYDQAVDNFINKKIDIDIIKEISALLGYLLHLRNAEPSKFMDLILDKQDDLEYVSLPQEHVLLNANWIDGYVLFFEKLYFDLSLVYPEAFSQIDSDLFEFIDPSTGQIKDSFWGDRLLSQSDENL